MLLWSCLGEVLSSFVIACIFIIFLFIINFFYLFSFPQHYPGITELDIEPYLEDEGTGNLRYVQVNCS